MLGREGEQWQVTVLVDKQCAHAQLSVMRMDRQRNSLVLLASIGLALSASAHRLRPTCGHWGTVDTLHRIAVWSVHVGGGVVKIGQLQDLGRNHLTWQKVGQRNDMLDSLR